MGKSKKDAPPVEIESVEDALERAENAVSNLAALRAWMDQLIETVGAGGMAKLWGISAGRVTSIVGRGGAKTIKPETILGYVKHMREELPDNELPEDPATLRDPRGRKKK